MANSSVPITPGSGANIDANTMGSGDFRQVVALGDATTEGNVQTVDSGGNAAVKQTCSTGAKSSVGASTSSVTVLASNTARRSFAVYNDSTVALYLDLTGGTATTSSFSVLLNGGDYYESPTPAYVGAVTGIWASATGSARVTEFT
jgi:hypothetical protein